MTATETPKVEYLSRVETAKLVRAALKRAFPTSKFSVRSESYAGGAAIHVGWTDGPQTADVDAIVGGFAGSGFDGMIDLKTGNEHWLLPDGSTRLRRSEIGHSYGTTEHELDAPVEGARLVHFGADFVQTQRRLSDELRGAFERAVVMLAGEPETAAFDGNRRYHFAIGGRWFDEYGSTLVHQLSSVDDDDLTDALLRESIRRDRAAASDGGTDAAPSPEEGTMSSTTEKPADALAAAEIETVEAAGAVLDGVPVGGADLDAHDELDDRRQAKRGRKADAKPARTVSKAQAARQRGRVGKSSSTGSKVDLMPDSVKEQIGDAVSKAAAKAKAAEQVPVPPAELAAGDGDATIAQARLDRQNGWTLAELKRAYPKFKRGWVEGVKPKPAASSTAPKARKRDDEDPLAITKEGPKQPRIAGELAAIVPWVKRRRIDFFGKPESSHRALGYRYGVSAQTAWRICHERTFESIKPAARNETEPAKLVKHDDLPPARVRKARKKN